MKALRAVEASIVVASFVVSASAMSNPVSTSETASAEEVMARYQARWSLKGRCENAHDNENEIVVCGRPAGNAHHRVRFPETPDTRNGANVLAERESLLRPGGRCSDAGAHGSVGCGGGLNVLAIGAALADAFKRLTDGE